jgi:hypothetical protein
MYHRVLLPIACAILTLPVWAQGSDLCPMTDAGGNCVRILACLGEEGRWFHGRAHGRGEGILSGVVNDGVTCSGVWVTQNAEGQGQANVTCSDGLHVAVRYDHQDVHTGTAIGQGTANTGEHVLVWSGKHVLTFFRDGALQDEANLQCGRNLIPLR